MALLSYFSPAIRTALQSHCGNKYVALHCADKKAVSWVLRWMLSGGLDKTYVNAPLIGDPIDCLSKRLQVVVELGIQGGLQHSLYEELKEAVLKGAVDINHLSWIFGMERPPYTKPLGKAISYAVVDAVLSGEMTTIIPSVRSNHVFATEIAAALAVRKGRLYAKQHYDLEPLSVFQLDFIYAFTKKEHEIRSMVVHDLIRLHYWQYVSNENIYIIYAERNTEFNDDWERAEQERFEFRVNNKLKSRMVTSTEQQVGAAPRKQDKRSQRRLKVTNKKHYANSPATQTSTSVPLDNDNTHSHTTPQADNSTSTPATVRPRPRQRFKINGPPSKSGTKVPHTVNTNKQKGSEIKAQKSIATYKKHVKATTSAPEDGKPKEPISPPAIPPPGKRIESDAVLRLTSNGELERERYCGRKAWTG